jgi:hypothetical protein
MEEPVTYRSDPEKRKQHQAKYYLENKEKKNAQSRDYYSKNTDKIKEQMSQRRKENPEEYRNRHLGYKGWTQALYETAFAEQQGKCAICGALPEDCRYGVLNADHEHTEPPKPRGLLCNLCNVGLGAFKDNLAALEAATNYLRKYSGNAT